MKRLLQATFVLTICFFATTMSAQYESAVGLRWEDDFIAASYKKSINDNIKAEAYFGLPTTSGVNLYLIGLNAALYTPFPEVDNLSYYYGAGAGLIFGDATGFLARGVGGLDYAFEDFPLNLSMELLPTLAFASGGSNFQFDFSFGARYILGR